MHLLLSTLLLCAFLVLLLAGLASVLRDLMTRDFGCAHRPPPQGAVDPPAIAPSEQGRAIAVHGVASGYR